MKLIRSKFCFFNTYTKCKFADKMGPLKINKCRRFLDSKQRETSGMSAILIEDSLNLYKSRQVNEENVINNQTKILRKLQEMFSISENNTRKKIELTRQRRTTCGNQTTTFGDYYQQLMWS